MFANFITVKPLCNDNDVESREIFMMFMNYKFDFEACSLATWRDICKMLPLKRSFTVTRIERLKKIKKPINYDRWFLFSFVEVLFSLTIFASF